MTTQLFARRIRPTVIEALTDARVVPIAGAKQVGKTTLPKEIATSEHPCSRSTIGSLRPELHLEVRPTSVKPCLPGSDEFDRALFAKMAKVAPQAPRGNARVPPDIAGIRSLQSLPQPADRDSPNAVAEGNRLSAGIEHHTALNTVLRSSRSLRITRQSLSRIDALAFTSTAASSHDWASRTMSISSS